jgi:hypothetical protein
MRISDFALWAKRNPPPDLQELVWRFGGYSPFLRTPGPSMTPTWPRGEHEGGRGRLPL